MDAVILRIIDLPGRTKGFTAKDENDDYNVYINARLSLEERAKAARHELEHIRRNHFYGSASVAYKEQEVKNVMTNK